VFSDPSKIIEQLDVQSGSRVADFGAGSGMYSFAVAKAVGEHGKVFAVEVQKELLGRLEREAHARKILNVEGIWGDIETAGGTHLTDNSCDAVVIANALFQVPDKNGLAREAARVLKSRGKLLVVDWSGSFGGTGPMPNAVVTAATARKIFESAGLAYERSVDAGAHHYGMIFKKT
jgi:ubiquinone/menaquinone biosynthesis C-methylase UbiE